MAFDALEELSEEGRQSKREDRNRDGRQDCPKKECVPLP